MSLQSTLARAAVTPFASRRENPALDDTLPVIGPTMRFNGDQEIYGEGEPAQHIYRVVSGAVRAFRVLSDGRRQIVDFYLPGEVFGVELGAVRRETAEAVSDAVLVAARRPALGAEAQDPHSARRLWRLAFNQLRRSEDHALTLGRRSAVERVASFLVDLATRIGHDGELEAPMSRQDMADYLGLTIETVSRTLSQLQTSGAISVCGRRGIRIRRPGDLAELCQ